MSVENQTQVSVVEIIRDDDTTAYSANHGVFSGGLTKHEVAKYYDSWAHAEGGDYDSHLNTSRYTGPEQTARRVSNYFTETQRPTARVLDVAAGTGRIGVELYNQGFFNIDALDPSEGMLRKAKARGVYTNLIQDFIGDDHKVPVQDGHYDALTCSGGFGEGHIPASAMHEMVRIVRSGGLICLTTRAEYLTNNPEYKRTMDQLEADAKWKLISTEHIDNYFCTKTGCVYQFVVL